MSANPEQSPLMRALSTGKDVCILEVKRTAPQYKKPLVCHVGPFAHLGEALTWAANNLATDTTAVNDWSVLYLDSPQKWERPTP